MAKLTSGFNKGKLILVVAVEDQGRTRGNEFVLVHSSFSKDISQCSFPEWLLDRSGLAVLW